MLSCDGCIQGDNPGIYLPCLNDPCLGIASLLYSICHDEKSQLPFSIHVPNVYFVIVKGMAYVYQGHSQTFSDARAHTLYV